MNPQMNYTPQQVMGHDSYSVPCRVGNWAEDEYMGALLTADHMARSEKGMLMTQKLESTLGSALAPAELSVLHPDGNVHFGDQIMLSNAPTAALTSMCTALRRCRTSVWCCASVTLTVGARSSSRGELRQRLGEGDH